MIHKKTSFNVVLAKIHRDLPTRDDASWQDFMEWAWDALEAINPVVQDDPKPVEIEVINSRARFPKDFYLIDMVGYNGQPMRLGNKTVPSTNYLHAPTSPNLVRNQSTEFYTVNKNFICTSFKEGTIYLSYYALDLDDDGFPLIPDHKSVKDYLTQHIDMKIGYKQWRTGKITRGDYELLETLAGEAYEQAKAHLIFPTYADMEAIRCTFHRFLPRYNQFDNFFANLSLPES